MQLTTRTERTIWIVLYLVIVLVSFIALGQVKNELADTKQELVITKNELIVAQQQTNNEPTKPSQVDTDESDIVAKDTQFFPISGEILKADLLSHPELIPYEGVLGGTMNFYTDEIKIVADKWVLAYFEDGHIGGYALFSYTGDQNTITRKLLDSYML